MSFEWPILLYGLVLIPILIALYVLAQRRRRRYAARFTNLELLSSVVGRGPGIRRHVPPLLFLLGLSALLVSLARPVAVIATPREQSAVMLVIDTSGSMQADDLTPSRMEAAKQAARVFVGQLPDQTEVGLVSFNTQASLESPLTRDHTSVLRAIDSLQARGGTAIGDGLTLALNHLDRQPTGTNGERTPAQVVLLSDGESHSGIAPSIAAQRAATDGVKVSTVGIGQRGQPVRLMNQEVGLDEKALQQMAETTGGKYFYAAESTQLENIYANLGTQVAWVEERTEVTALVSAAGTVFLIIGGLLGLRWFQQFP